MRRFLNIFIGLCVFFALAIVSFAGEIVSGPNIPQKSSNLYVHDFANVINEDDETEITSVLSQLEKDTTSQVTVVTVSDLQGYSREEYALALGRGWGVGQKDFNNGVVFLLAPIEREVRIEVGYGLEGVLPDILVGKILDDRVIPFLSVDDFSAGMREGALAIAEVVRGEEFVTKKSQNGFVDLLNIYGEDLLFFVLIIFWGLLSFLSQTKSWWLGGVFGGVAGVLLFGLMGLVVCAVIGLLLDFFVSKFFYKRIIFPHGGGGRGGFGGGGFGGGGSFGGGSFGGGGAGRSF